MSTRNPADGMNGCGTSEGAECQAVQESLVWLPGADLEDGERERIDDHVRSCPDCAHLLRAVDALSGALRLVAPHPDPERLVQFAEAPDDLPAAERASVEEHLACCSSCSREVDILKSVETELQQPGSMEAVLAPGVARGTELPGQGPVRAEAAQGRPIGVPDAGTRPPLARRIWEQLARSLLRPVPAALYLGASVVALLMLVTRPSGPVHPTADGNDIGISGSPHVLGGVTLLGDDLHVMRGPGEGASESPVIAPSRANFLLLELTGLADPPLSGDTYEVRLSRSGGTGEPVWTGRIRGQEFAETYTICLSLSAETLASGMYVATVLAPGDSIIYRASFRID